MATISNVFQNPSGYSGYQSLLKKKPAQSVPQRPTQSLGTFNSSNSSMVPTAAKKTTAATPAAAPVSDRNSQLESIKQQALGIQSQLNSMPKNEIRDVPSPNKGLLSTKDVNPALSFSGLVDTLANRAQNPTKDMNDVLKRQLALSNDLSEFRNEAATAPERIYSAGGGAKVVQGRLQGVQLANAAREQAMATQLGELRDVYGNLLTGQGQAITGLTNAANLTQPQLGAVGQVPFNPLDLGQGTILGSQGGGIQQAGGLLGELEAAKQRALTGGTAFSNTAAQGYSNAVQQYVAADTAFKQAEGQATNLQNTMQGVNALDARFANQSINKLRNQFGDAKYTAFVTALAEAQQAYTSLLASVGAATPTVNGEQANLILNPSSTPAQINAAINQLNLAAKAKLDPMYQQIATYQGNLGGSTGGTGSGGLYDW